MKDLVPWPCRLCPRLASCAEVPATYLPPAHCAERPVTPGRAKRAAPGAGFVAPARRRTDAPAFAEAPAPPP